MVKNKKQKGPEGLVVVLYETYVSRQFRFVGQKNGYMVTPYFPDYTVAGDEAGLLAVLLP